MPIRRSKSVLVDLYRRINRVRIEYPGAVYSVEAITAKRSFATNRTDLDILRSFLFAESCGETGCTDTFARASSLDSPSLDLRSVQFALAGPASSGLSAAATPSAMRCVPASFG